MSQPKALCQFLLDTEFLQAQSQSMKQPSVEQISIWVLEALEEEWRRDPSLLTCHPASQVLGPLKAKYKIEDADITRALTFMISPSRQYLQIVNRDDGQAILPSDTGLAILGKIALSRIEEQEKKKWTRADKIALASLAFSVIAFVVGVFIGDHLSKKSDNTQPALQHTNATSH
jgi:hypothetical protein